MGHALHFIGGVREVHWVVYLCLSLVTGLYGFRGLFKGLDLVNQGNRSGLGVVSFYGSFGRDGRFVVVATTSTGYYVARGVYGIVVTQLGANRRARVFAVSQGSMNIYICGSYFVDGEVNGNVTFLGTGGITRAFIDNNVGRVRRRFDFTQTFFSSGSFGRLWRLLFCGATGDDGFFGCFRDLFSDSTFYTSWPNLPDGTGVFFL